MTPAQGITMRSWDQSHRLAQSNLPAPPEILGSLKHS